jgi:subtilisin family serine protease
VLDGGLVTSHPDLNVAGGVNCANGKGSWEDQDGHGTLVGGIIGALDNSQGFVGAAPGARLWGVRVARKNGRTTDSEIICGLDWVIANAATIEVANMSLGGKGTDDGNCGNGKPRDALHQAVCATVAAGVTVVVSAGNEAVDASKVKPAAYDEVITVSAISDTDGQTGALGGLDTCGDGEADDQFATFSNYGADVDLAAPGVCVESTYLDDGYGHGSGTSFSAPIVSGAAALYISTHPYVSPAAVRTALIAAAESGTYTGDPDSTHEPVVNFAAL